MQEALENLVCNTHNNFKIHGKNIYEITRYTIVLIICTIMCITKLILNISLTNVSNQLYVKQIMKERIIIHYKVYKKVNDKLPDILKWFTVIVIVN